MLIYLLAGTILLISAGLMLYIIFQKMPNLAAINVETIPKEKEMKVKNRIMTERLARNYKSAINFLSKVLKPINNDLSNKVSRLYQQIMDLEKKIQPQPLKALDLNHEIKEKLEAAQAAFAERDFDQAEELCIAVVELNPRNIDVYELLANIYLELKEYKEARETRRYLLKLLAKNFKENESSGEKHRLANCYAELGWIYQLENRPEMALANFEKAVELEPSNPRFLDLLLKISIILNNKKLALQAFNSLRETDPDNQKLPELREQINSLSDPGKRKSEK